MNIYIIISINMASWLNELDYSNLNKSLQPKKSGLLEIKNDTVEAIWKVFLQSNGLKIDENMNCEKVKRRNERMNEFANNIEEASDWMKSKFIITVDYLVKNNPKLPDKIKSLRVAELKNESISKDKKLENILSELTKSMSEKKRHELDQHVSIELINLSKESQKSSELWKQIEDLQNENKDLKDELTASDTAREIALNSSWSSWSFKNANRIQSAIKNIREDSSLDKEEKARKILLRANSYIVFGTWVSINLRRILPFGKFDVNKEYTKIIDKLSKKAENATDKEKLAIMYIIDEVDKAHKEYLEATNISEKEKKENKKRIVWKMVA